MVQETIKNPSDTMAKDAKNIKITLKYSGSDVNDGTMSVEDIVPALQGFSSLYGKLASDLDTNYQHKLRITGVQQGSFEVILAVWNTLGSASANLQGVTSAATIAKAVIKSAFKLIEVTKHVKQQPFDATPKSGVQNTIQIKNSENVTIEIPVNIYNYYQDKTMENDLNKIVKPIEPEKIDKAEIRAQFDDEDLTASINLSEKPYFEAADHIITTTKRTWVQGHINTMTKTTNKGAIYLADGTRVPFKLSGDHPEQFYRFFGHQGLVKVLSEVNLDDNLKPVSLEIFDIQEVQTAMFDQ